MKELEVGDVIANFTLPSDQESSISLDDFKEKNIIIYFYPKDDTPGCTLEANDFSCYLDSFHELNTVVLGISRDSIKKHEKFRVKYDLKHYLLSDETLEICQKFNCWVEKSMYGKKYMAVARSTFFIDENRVLKKIWRNVSAKGHVEEVLKYIRDFVSKKN